MKCLVLALLLASSSASAEGVFPEAQTGGLSLGGGTLSGSLLLSDGTLAAPSWAFSSDIDTGMKFPAASSMEVVQNGVVTWVFGSGQDFSGVSSVSALRSNSIGSGLPGHAFTLDTDSGLYRLSANNIGLGVGGAGVMTFASDGRVSVVGTSPTISACGTAPSISGTSSAGKVVIGTVNPATCLVTFATAFSSPPACVVTGDDTAISYTATTTATAMTLDASGVWSSDVISYICMGL